VKAAEPQGSPDVSRPLVLAAMSGGVDSAVAAACLKEQGYPLLGVTMKLWDYAEVGGDPVDRDGRCCSLETVGGARNTAEILGIPFYVMDMTGPFRHTVIDNFISEYRAGRTPNPCVVCNNKIKWSALYDRARSVGALKLATGHYARVRLNAETGRYELLKGKDASRDQSYVLYGLSQEQLAATLFPLGDFLKTEVREKARQLKLPVADTPESREICFITDDNYRRFLREKLSASDPARRPGALVDECGTEVGRHDGYADFTVGQRRGLGVALGRPYYVSRIDASTGNVHIAPDDHLYGSETLVEQVNWVSVAPPASPLSARVKIRYLHPGEEAIVEPLSDGRVSVHFCTPQRALTPGQSAVFYDGDRVLGGGLVAQTS
jgi:tRNA-specific 2-thiouridylase